MSIPALDALTQRVAALEASVFVEPTLRETIREPVSGGYGEPALGDVIAVDADRLAEVNEPVDPTSSTLTLTGDSSPSDENEDESAPVSDED